MIYRVIYQIKLNLEMFENDGTCQQSERRRDLGNGECLLWGIFISAFWTWVFFLVFIKKLGSFPVR